MIEAELKGKIVRLEPSVRFPRRKDNTYETAGRGIVVYKILRMSMMHPMERWKENTYGIPK